MGKYLLFGLMPIRVSEDTQGWAWTADVSRCPAGKGVKNVVANGVARAVLRLVGAAEKFFGVVIPVKITKYEPRNPQRQKAVRRRLTHA